MGGTDVPPKQHTEGNMIERLQDIFKGLESAYGQTKLTNELRADGKNEVKSYTIKKPITDLLWKQHLEGVDPALGIVPINENNECRWGCIDIDTYPFDHLKLIKKIREKELPLIVFRSKSGGAHVFLFVKEFIPASLMRQKLQMIASSLGYAKAEIFPKQSTIKADRGDVGNFLNMPYHGGNRTVRYAIDDEGQSLTIENFCQQYDQYVQTIESIKSLFINKKSESVKEDEAFPDGPPCLNTIIKNGPVVEGNGDIAASGRDDGLFNIGVYLKKAFPANWQDKLDDYNDEKYVKPKLKSEDVIRIKKQLDKKDYDYKCEQKPICNFCNEKLCYTKQFGKGDEVRMPNIANIRKYPSDPPIFFVTVDEDTIEVDGPTLHDAEKFSVVCMTELGTPLLPVAKLIWRKMIAKLMKNMDILEAPDDTKITVQLKELVTDFISRDADKIEDVLTKRPYTDKKGITYFKFKDLWKFLLNSKSWPEKTYPKNKTIRLMEDLFEAKVKVMKISDESHKIWNLKKTKVEKFTPIKREKQPAPFE